MILAAPLLALTVQSKTLPAWAALKAVYAAPAISKVALKTIPVSDPEFEVSDLEFPSSGGGTAHGTLIRPRGYAKSPLILLMHDLNDWGDKILRTAARPMLASGYAVLALDAPHHGRSGTTADQVKLNSLSSTWYFGTGDLAERMFKGDDNRHLDENFIVETIRTGVRDYSRVLTLLEKQPYVDLGRCGAFGYGLGSLTAGVLGGVDWRIQSVFLAFGGDPLRPYLDRIPDGPRRLAFAACCPSLFLADPASGTADVPNPCYVALMSGTTDAVFPSTAAQQVLGAVRNAEEIRVNADHLSPTLAVQPAVRWFDRTVFTIGSAMKSRPLPLTPPEWHRTGSS